MSALSYYLEREGLVTTGISLVRENTESMQPPRALWVPFPLGRPLGKPGDAEFQHGVIRAAMDLLNRREGPVLEDYPLDVPALVEDSGAACPVSFTRNRGTADTWKARLEQEFSQLKPWYELARRRRRGRTLVGIAEKSPEQNLPVLAGYLDEGLMPTDPVWLKRAIEDIKAYYIEAMTAQPGEHDSRAIQARFWQESCFGEALLVFYHQFQQSDDNRLKLIARILVPREAVGASTGPEGGKRQ
ncbi:MAG: hypothetical protein ACFHX7_18600 [Pseudomonadota bacterium]